MEWHAKVVSQTGTENVVSANIVVLEESNNNNSRVARGDSCFVCFLQAEIQLMP